MKHFKWLWSVWPFEVLALVFKALQANCHYESRWTYSQQVRWQNLYEELREV